MRARAAMAALALAAGCATEPVADSPAFAPVLDRELAAIVDDASCPLASLSVLAIRDGRVVYERGFGRRFIDPAAKGGDRPAQAATLYRIASISKLVTTLGAMELVEEGKLSLDADIGTYLGYPVRNPHYPDAPITLRMLLTHTSSLRDDAGYYSWPAGADLREFLTPGGKLYGSGAMWSDRAPPGKYFNYANLPWGVAATAMEKATGERFDRLMKRLVLDPMGLSGGYDPAQLAPPTLANLATLYRKASAGDEQVWNPHGPWVVQVDDYSRAAPTSRVPEGYEIGSNATLFGPQGGLRASVQDLGRVMRMLMDGGEIDGRRVLARETVDAILARQWEREGGNGQGNYGSHRGRFNAWGLGNQQFLDVSGPDFGDRLVEDAPFPATGHLGDAYGLMGTLAFDRATRSGLVFLAGGTGCDPETQRGKYSAGARFEERIVTALHRRAVRGIAD